MRWLVLSVLPLIWSCERPDTIAPRITLLPDPQPVHYLDEPYVDPGASVLDNLTCNTEGMLYTDSQVDVSHYGSYQVIYTATDEAANSQTAVRDVDIVLATTNYHHLYYQATDTCTSGIYTYVGLIQDCDCEGQEVTVANISNFGLSATFDLPVTGIYNEILELDTLKTGVYFLGNATMSSGADTLFWTYTITADGDDDVCHSQWVKE